MPTGLWLVPWLGAVALCWTSLRARRAASIPEPGPGRGCASTTVVVPVRNEAPRIRGLLESLLAQDHPSFEVLVVDDGSTDGTLDAARAAAAGDPRVRFLRLERRPPGWQGKLYALSIGARDARGEWLIFVDADKRLTRSTFLRALIAECEQRGVAAASALGPYLGDRWWHRWWYRPIVDNPALVGGAFLVQRLRPRATWLIGTLAMRRETYEAIGGAHAAALYGGGAFDDWGWTRLFEMRRARTALLFDDGLHDVSNWEAFPEAWNGMSRWVAAFLVCRRGALPALALGTAAVLATGLATGRVIADLASLRLPPLPYAALAAVPPTFGIAYCRTHGYRLAWAVLAAPIAVGMTAAVAGGITARLRNRVRWRDLEIAVVAEPPSQALNAPRP